MRPGTSRPDLDRSHLADALKEAAASAKKQFVHVQTTVDVTRNGISQLQESLRKDKIDITGDHAEAIRKAFADFEQRLTTIQADFEASIGQKMEERRRHLDVFTVMLFGRTMAGKSTVMEALTAGKGTSIGIGLQNTTTEITEYRWQGLRVVDTPGIEGLDKGPELAALAKGFVDEADAIVFVCNDDAIMPADFEAMRFIRDQNKPIWVVLNVKHGDVLDVLEDPDMVFRSEELDGHMRRINGTMRERMGLPQVEIIPVHAWAAWLASRPDRAEGQIKQRLGQPGVAQQLRSASRFHILEDFLVKRIAASATHLRSKAAHESVTHHLTLMHRELVQANRDLRRLSESAGEWKKSYQKRCDRIWATGIEILKELRSSVGVMQSDAYGAAESAVDGKLDANQWLKDKSSELASIAQRLQEQVCGKVNELNAEFTNLMSEELGALSAAIKVEAADVSGGHRGSSFNWSAATRIGGSILSGAIGLAGVFVGLTNPVGWAVIGASVLLGFLSQWLGSNISERNDRAHRRAVDKLVRQLRDNLWKSYESLQEASYQWLRRCLDGHREHGLGLLTSQYRMLVKSRELTRQTAALLAEQADATSLHVLRSMMESRIGVIRNQTLAVSAVARRQGTLSKVVLDGPENKIGLVVGPGGSVIRAVSDDLGERIDVCARSSDPETMLRRLLRIDGDAAWACQASAGRWTVSRANGSPRHVPSGLELELASRLCKADIHLERPRS